MLNELKDALFKSHNDYWKSYYSSILERIRTFCVIISLTLQVTSVIIQLYILHHLIGIH